MLSGFGDAALLWQAKFGISEAVFQGGQIPQVSFAVAHSTLRLSKVLPLRGN